MRAGTSPMRASLATPRSRLIAPASPHLKPDHRGVRRAFNGSKFDQSVAWPASPQSAHKTSLSKTSQGRITFPPPARLEGIALGWGWSVKPGSPCGVILR